MIIHSLVDRAGPGRRIFLNNKIKKSAIQNVLKINLKMIDLLPATEITCQASKANEYRASRSEGPTIHYLHSALFATSRN